MSSVPIMFPPQRNFVFVPEPHQLREQIAAGEKLADAIWTVLPCFMTMPMTEDNAPQIEDQLLDLRDRIRDFLCCELEQKLADQLANPLPTPEDIQNAQREFEKQAYPKPKIETLMKAQQSVSMLEDAIQKIHDLEDSPMREALMAATVPQYEMQLVSAREFLTQVQTAMEEPDEVAAPELSNDVPPGEAQKD